MQPLQLSPRYSEALPMYYRLQQTLIDKIICQDWKAGMQLPSEREIAATMGITSGLSARRWKTWSTRAI